MDPAAPSPPQEAFISHSSQDRAFVAALGQVLRKHGVRTWWSEKHLVGSPIWHAEIGDALRRCDWFLLVLSPAAIRSKWVFRELMFALNQDRLKDRIVPLHLKNCDAEGYSWALSAYQRIDFRKRFAPGCRDLLKLWRLAFQERKPRRESP